MGELHKAAQFLSAAAESDSRVSKVNRGHALIWKGLALWNLGFPDQALALAREGLMLGEHADNQYTYAAVLQNAGSLHWSCGELARAEDLFRAVLNLGTERRFPLIRALNTLFLGLVSALRKQTQASLEQLRRAIEFYVASPAAARQDRVYAGPMAVGYLLTGRPDEALATLTSALEWADQKGAEFLVASLHQHKGHLLRGKSNSEEAENCFRASIEIARRHSAKSLELARRPASLGRSANKAVVTRARAMLAEDYNWFTKGFDTTDLKDAEACSPN